MAKEFDICLRGRTFEGNLLVTSLPFRDGIAAANEIILFSSVDRYTLIKSTSATMDYFLNAHIDRFVKTSYERLSLSARLNADAVFGLYSIANPNKNSISLCAGLSDLNYLSPIEVEHRIDVESVVLGTNAVSSFSLENFNTKLDCAVSNEQMDKYEGFDSTFSVSAIIAESATKHIEANDTIGISSNVIPNLKRYRLLGETSEHTLNEIDEITLGDLTYIIY